MKVFLRYRFIPENMGVIWDTTTVTVKECKDSDLYYERLRDALADKKFSGQHVDDMLIQFYVLKG